MEHFKIQILQDSNAALWSVLFCNFCPLCVNIPLEKNHKLHSYCGSHVMLVSLLPEQIFFRKLLNYWKSWNNDATPQATFENYTMMIIIFWQNNDDYYKHKHNN